MIEANRFLAALIFLLLSCSLRASGFDEGEIFLGPVVRREERKSLVVTDYGEVSAVDIGDGTRLEPYHIQFITLEPNSLFLPVLLHADMVFYVHTGRGRLHWGDDDELRKVNLRGGDVYRLHSGTVFYMQSNLETEREKLRIFAFFANPENDSYEREIGPYSSIIDLVQGFDRKVLREAFKVSDEAIEELVSGVRPPQIVHAVPTKEKKKKKTFWEMEARFLKSFSEGRKSIENNKKKQAKVYNIFDEKPDFENCNGWSLTVNQKKMHLLRGSNVGLFMVNLTKGSMMGPHWNPTANEVAIVLKGTGMVRVVNSNDKNSSIRSSTRLRVGEGDVFAVPRFHPMAQMSFNNGSMVFMGFTTTTRRNHPQFLAGKSSVLRALDREVMAVSFNVNASVIEQVLGMQEEAVILECASCAEEEERVMQREREEARKREEEEARKREEEEEEEEEKRREEEEEARKERERREEEEERRREEEERKRREEEEAKREEEEKKRREEEEEEEKRREEEEKARKERERREEEEERRREEDERKRREEEEAKREEEEKKRREEEEEEEARRKEEERKWEEEEARKQEEERQEREREEEKEEEEEEEEERERKWEEEEARKQEEERRTREKEERRESEEGERREREEEEEGGGGRYMKKWKF